MVGAPKEKLLGREGLVGTGFRRCIARVELGGREGSAVDEESLYLSCALRE